MVILFCILNVCKNCTYVSVYIHILYICTYTHIICTCMSCVFIIKYIYKNTNCKKKKDYVLEMMEMMIDTDNDNDDDNDNDNDFFLIFKFDSLLI